MADKKELNLEEMENVAGGAHLARNPHGEPDAVDKQNQVIYEGDGIKITSTPKPSDDTEYRNKQKQPQTQPFTIDGISMR